jgi:2-dehydropantoate 2-reductase
MNIAIVGAGRIGSTFAFHLSRAGHDITAIARGSRLETLRRDEAIVSVDGKRAPVRAAAELDEAVPYDLVIVTVLAHQVGSLVPVLAKSAARSVLFLFNTFETIDRWRDAIGAQRFSFGFPSMIAFFDDGRLRSRVVGPGLVTTLDSAKWAAVLQAAGMPAELELDMNSFLRSHVAFVVPTMLAAHLTYERDTELRWSEAKQLTAALLEGLALVRELGHTLKPAFVVWLARLPSFVLTALLWIFGRTAAVKDLAELGPGEARELIDAMAAAAPGRTPKLVALRP